MSSVVCWSSSLTVNCFPSLLAYIFHVCVSVLGWPAKQAKQKVLFVVLFCLVEEGFEMAKCNLLTILPLFCSLCSVLPLLLLTLKHRHTQTTTTTTTTTFSLSLSHSDSLAS